jgi:hypothetical protein
VEHICLLRWASARSAGTVLHAPRYQCGLAGSGGLWFSLAGEKLLKAIISNLTAPPRSSSQA